MTCCVYLFDFCSEKADLNALFQFDAALIPSVLKLEAASIQRLKQILDRIIGRERQLVLIGFGVGAHFFQASNELFAFIKRGQRGLKHFCVFMRNIWLKMFFKKIFKLNYFIQPFLTFLCWSIIA